MATKERILTPAVFFRGKEHLGANNHSAIVREIARQYELEDYQVEIELFKTNGYGFKTTMGRFVDREVGWDIAEKAGQLTSEAKKHGLRVLHSDEFIPPKLSRDERRDSD